MLQQVGLDGYTQLGSIDCQGHAFLLLQFSLLYKGFAEGGDVLFLHPTGFGKVTLQFGQFLDVGNKLL